jgi:hypothetical protein
LNACGTATTAGSGAASWHPYITGYTPSVTPCGSGYPATRDFTLASDPGSTLVLDEGGSLCGLGHDGATYRGYFAGEPKADGYRFAIVGNWPVDPGLDGPARRAYRRRDRPRHVVRAHPARSYTGTLS